MPTITVDIRGLKTRIERVNAALAPAVLLRIIGARLSSFVDESFRTRGRGQWMSLAPSTIQIRGSAPPLQRSPRYKQSFVTKTDDRTYVEIGSNHPAAEFQEWGTGIWGARGSTYTIRAKNAKTLAAALPGGGFIIFGPVVEHTGVPARPVLPTRAEVDRILPPVINAILEKSAAIQNG